MSEFKGKIPLTPKFAKVIYAHPYQTPSYQHELIRLKKIEKSIQLHNKMIEEKKRIKDDLETLQKSISNLSNYAADLSSILLNYREIKTEALFNELNNIVIKEKLNIIGDDENLRCEEIKVKFASLIADPPRKKRKH